LFAGGNVGGGVVRGDGIFCKFDKALFTPLSIAGEQLPEIERTTTFFVLVAFFVLLTLFGLMTFFVSVTEVTRSLLADARL
jgi:hypothetical protein